MWTGKMELEGVKVEGAFEVFDSGGGWAFLFGKPLLASFRAIHDYQADVVHVSNGPQSSTLHNQLRVTQYDRWATWQGVHVVLDWKQYTNLAGGDNPPSRQVSRKSSRSHEKRLDPVRNCSPADTQLLQVEIVDLGGFVETMSDSEVSGSEGEDEKTKDESAVEERRAHQILTADDEQHGQHEIEEFASVHARDTDQGDDESPSRTVPFLSHSAPSHTNLPLPRDDAPCLHEEHQRKPPRPTVEEIVDEEHMRNQRVNAVGSKEMLPSREVPPHMSLDPTNGDINPIFVVDPIDPGVEVWPTSHEPADPASVFTRNTDPFNPKRVEAILEQVTIGPSLSTEERCIVTTLLMDFADCFALSVSEVKHVDGAFHHLDIPPDATFNVKPRQRPLTPPQRKFFNGKIDEMLEAGIIEAVHPSRIKAISPTTLAQKAHEGGGLTLEELQHCVNDECLTAGLPNLFDLPPRPATRELQVPEARLQKWHICQNFNEVNKVTHVASMPQGDIRAKQQCLSGHKYLSVFDFVAGFYAVEVDEESRPYTAFYVEGRGYFWYLRMPFGLTGAPASFAFLTAKHLHDLLTDGVMELLVDDGGAAADTFDEMLAKLRLILTRVRERNLSLSPSKSSFFMTEAVFAGARVGPDGVLPDLTKLTAIVDWAQPADALNLTSFLGLTGHF
ncbi:hypothetical protein EWM64_g4890 [Hericium alpestre]|uniref:Reverse transcriptase domain-containing protein n=1 Tax=Hericium alpestre TaxID=135208 RepID=A0A4Y9ZWC4_9AGAM|nr:hypothetical protein EWM64_g4890 [Hericium alpestre]